MTTFVRTRPGTFDPATGLWSSPTTASIAGSAIQVRGNPQRYASLGLNLVTMPTLFFTPDDYELSGFSDEFVKPGDVVVWDGITYAVRDVDPIAPDGIVVAARIVVST